MVGTFVLGLRDQSDWITSATGLLREVTASDDAVFTHGVEAGREPHPAGVVETDRHVLDLERLGFRVVCVSAHRVSNSKTNFVRKGTLTRSLQARHDQTATRSGPQ